MRPPLSPSPTRRRQRSRKRTSRSKPPPNSPSPDSLTNAAGAHAPAVLFWWGTSGANLNLPRRLPTSRLARSTYICTSPSFAYTYSSCINMASLLSSRIGSEHAAALREIRRACKLGALDTDEELRRFWVDTDTARDPERPLVDRILDCLDDSDDGTRILVYGHGGSGKTTELSRVAQKLDEHENWFPITFSVRDEMNLAAVQAEDIFVVLVERLLHAAQNPPPSISDSPLDVKGDHLQPLLDYLSESTVETEKSQEKSLAVSAEAAVNTETVLLKLLKLLGSVKGDIKLSSNHTQTQTLKLRKRPAELLHHVNMAINAVRLALPSRQRILFIVEDLDKLDIATAKRVFIDNVNLLAGIKSDIIYTIPIFTYHSHEASNLDNQFSSFGLPMIKVINLDQTRANGFKIVREIVIKRIGENAIEPDALDLLVEKTGGVLQHVFEVLFNSALMTSSTVPLTRDVIGKALKNKQTEFWSDISLPTPAPEGVTLDLLFDRLVECAKCQLGGKKNHPKIDPIYQILLRCCAIVEYNGDRWYGVHPLVIDNLRELGRL
ncbi:MAG TPA: hypothetical protein DCP71_02485 [Verrucomicrobiales bacterium]|nr:hypothetical protein [Verrucomicrobiales bacterium]